MFAFICMFHIVRGVESDAIIFAIFTLIEIASWRGWLPTFTFSPRLNPWLVRGVLVAAFAIMFLTPRNGPLDVFLLLSLAPIAIAAVNFKDAAIKSPKFVIRSRIIWLTLIMSMAVVELVAYIVANILQDDKNWPTVSVLVLPVLDSPIGRTIFMVIWVGAGWGGWRLLAGLREQKVSSSKAVD